MGVALDEEVAAFMRAGAGTGRPADLIKETPIAVVFLVGDLAFKLKKAVDFGFVDYSTLARRRWAVERELSFNRVYSTDIYRAVRPIIRATDGLLRLGESDAELVIEWVLEMRRFDEDAILTNCTEQVQDGFAEALGRDVARLHAGASVRRDGGGVGALGYTVRSNAEQLRRLAPALGDAQVESLIAATDTALSASSDLLEARRRQGLARRCHGDLHLANIVVENGRPTPFDCIEFNDRLSDVDVLYDVAFLLMDLLFRRQVAGANRVFNGWLDEAARSDGGAVWRGLAVLPLCLSVRAAVRAHVVGGDDPAQGRLYLDAALAHLQPAPVVLHAVGGLSGSGKTTFARRTAPPLGAPPGAVILRSDEIRKRLWGRPPTERLPAAAYVASESERVYAQMLREAEALLAAGGSVVLDAVFLRRRERDDVEAMARRLGVDFSGVWLEGPAELLAERLSARRGDASDADSTVLAAQLACDRGDLSAAWRRLPAA